MNKRNIEVGVAGLALAGILTLLVGPFAGGNALWATLGVFALLAAAIWQWHAQPLHWQMLSAMILAILVFLFHTYHPLRHQGPVLTLDWFFPLGDLFVRLLKMVIVPLVFSSILCGMAGLQSLSQMKRLGFKAFAFYGVTSTCAILIGLFLSNGLRPGDGVSAFQNGRASVIDPDSLTTVGSGFDLLLRMIPLNPIQALAEGDMLGLIFFALLLGLALMGLPAERRRDLMIPMERLFEAMTLMTSWIIRLAPLGVFGLILKALTFTDTSLFAAIGKYMLTLVLGLTLHLIVVLPLLLKTMTGRPYFRQFRDMANAMMTAFSTSSSSATLPVTMECVEKNAGVSQKISGFILPLGATINMDGTALYECAGVLFIAQVLGVELSLFQQAMVVVTALLASVGAAGIPSAGLVMIFIVLDAVSLRGPEVNTLVGIMLAVDRPLDMMRTMVNVFSDTVGAVIIADSEDPKKG